MSNFFDRFKPKDNKKNDKDKAKKDDNSMNNAINNFLGGFKIPGGGNKSFQGQGQSLGGNAKPGKVIEVVLSEPGPLGIHLEKMKSGGGGGGGGRGASSTSTAIVGSVIPGSQADRAGIQRGDILCFQGSDGTEEILYDLFLQLAKSDQRPLCFEIRRIPTSSAARQQQQQQAQRQQQQKSGKSKGQSAEDYAKKQAMIAAAEARDRAAKAKMKPLPKKNSSDLPVLMSTAERNQLEQERLKRMGSSGVDSEDGGPKSEASRQATEMAKQSEARLAQQLGYNPYETSRATAGQARTATVATKHGEMQPEAPSTFPAGGSNNTTRRTTPTTSQPAGNNGNTMAAIPSVRPPSDPLVAVGTPPPSPEFESAYEAAVTGNDHGVVVTSFPTLRKLIVNATTKGQRGDPDGDSSKFRRVRLSNAKIKSAVVDVEGALELMMSVGFQLHVDDASSDSYLVYPPSTPGPSWLAQALRRMEQYEQS